MKNLLSVAVLKNPWLLLATVVVSIYVGQKWPDFGTGLVAPGRVYLSLLTMTVLPIITSAIVTGLARLLRSGSANTYLSKMVVLFLVTVFLGSALGMLVALIGKPGSNLGARGEAFLGSVLLSEMTTQSDVGGASGGGGAGGSASGTSQGSGGGASGTSSGGGTASGGSSVNFLAIIQQMIPSNIFAAFSQGEILAIIFASTLLGAAIGVSKTKTSDRFLETFQGMQEAFVKILSWVLYGLPLGLFCMIGGQVATLGIDAILALSKFILLFHVASIILFILYLVIMSLAMRISIFKILTAMRDTLFLAFSAASSVAPIPMALDCMERDLDQPPDICNLVIPLTVAMNRHSYAMLFSFTAVFMTQLFDQPMTVTQGVAIFFLSALAGTAAAGRLASVGLVLGYVINPIGLPLNVAITVYVTLGAILDPVVQMGILFGGCANAAVIGRIKTVVDARNAAREKGDAVGEVNPVASVPSSVLMESNAGIR